MKMNKARKSWSGRFCIAAFSVLVFIVWRVQAGVVIGNSVHSQTLVLGYGLGENIIISDKMTIRPTFEEYLKERNQIISEEEKRAIGADIDLSSEEKLANDIIMAAKNKEMVDGFHDPFSFNPSRHLFEVLDKINSSKLFKLIRNMPKGAVLHAHDTALCSADYVLSLTYRPNLWQCYNASKDIFFFKFSRVQPQFIDGCQWILVSSERQRRGSQEYDKLLRKHFTLYTKNPEKKYKDINEVWKYFGNTFYAVDSILVYKPVWKDYFWRALEEFYQDNVQYLEFRGTLPQLYDLDGNEYSQQDVVQIYYDTLNEFKEQHPDFIGSKLIYAPVRKVNDAAVSEYMKTVVELQERFPNFVAGFDLVGQEDTGRPLIDFANMLLALPNNISFFFHAGETNWYGTSTDQNLIDAVLLGTKRIGHGYGIIKHPSVLDIVKEKGIAIEVNPISNQVLKLNNDNRNHPCSFLFANNYPVVISSDDPSFWEATPLSHDFYIAFLGIASAHADLRTLKQLAINSITYSSLTSAEKEVAFRKWQVKWDEYIEWVATQKD